MNTRTIAFAGLLLAIDPALAQEGVLEEVVVTAEFRAVETQDLATSVSVFNQDAIERRGATHLEQLLNLEMWKQHNKGALSRQERRRLILKEWASVENVARALETEVAEKA